MFKIISTFAFQYIDNIYQKKFPKLQYLKHVKDKTPTLNSSIDNHIFMTAPAWNEIYFPDWSAVKYVHLHLSTKEYMCSL